MVDRAPHYWNCPLSTGLNKTLSQPWFQVFAREPARPMTDPMSTRREGLKAILRSDLHDRPDIWYVLEDGSNLDEVVADLLQVLLSTLPDIASLRDPCVASARMKSGEFANPDSPHGVDLIEAADAACAGDRARRS